MTTNAQADDFDIGKAIFDQLKELTPERQQRIIRWVSEALGVPASTITPQAPPLVGVHNPTIPAHFVSAQETYTDIKTFVASKSPKSDQQFAATVAYFYRFAAPPAERRDSIDSNALQEATRLAGRNRLASPITTLNNAKRSGYLDSLSPGDFTINTVGENLVAMTLPGSGEIQVQKTRKKAKKG
jgi:hypothetical protein